jgi:uncharacterized Zn finger protein
MSPRRPTPTGARGTMAKRGSIGESWWSRKFIDPLEASADKGRLSRGRTYARGDHVLQFDIHPGVVRAKVEGSQPFPYRVTVGCLDLDDGQWDAVCAALAGKALFRSALLAGEMPQEIEEVFAECGIALFPRRFDDLDVSCTCPDWGYPCKHVAALLYVLADHFDADPFAVLAWRGREREELLAAIRAHAPTGTAGEATPEGGAAVRLAPLEQCADSFWEAEAPPPLEPRPSLLDPLVHLGEEEDDLAASLRPLYDALTGPETPAPGPHD